jgi:hypothetical protein
MDNTKYHQIYQTILQSSKLCFPDVQAILCTGRHLEKVLSQVVNHVVHWLNVNPTQVSEYDPNKPQLWQDFLPALDRESSTLLDKARCLQCQIFDIVYKRLDEFAESINSFYLSKWSSVKDDFYFKQFECLVWKDLLVRVYRMVDVCFQGLFVKFNTEDPGHLLYCPKSTLVQAFTEAITQIPDVSHNPALGYTKSLDVLIARITPIVTAWATEQCKETQKAKRLNQMSPGPLVAQATVMAEHSKPDTESSKSSLGKDDKRELDRLLNFPQTSTEGLNADINSDRVIQTSMTLNPRAMLPTRQLFSTEYEMYTQRQQHCQNHSGQSSVDQQQNHKEDLEVLYIKKP